jgi:hypothetical protein
MLDKKHKEILRGYEKNGVIPRVISMERHLDDSGKEKQVVLLSTVFRSADRVLENIVPDKPVSRVTLWRWNKEDKSVSK